MRITRDVSKTYGDAGFWYINNLRYNFPDDGSSDARKLSNDELFGVFCLLAPMVEVNEAEKHITDVFKKDSTYAVQQLREIFLARLKSRKIGQIPLALDLNKFSKEQGEIIQNWVQRSVNFVQQSAAASG